MKKIHYLLAGCLLLSACEDFLEEKPRSQVSTDAFYNNLDEATRALSGVYSYLDGMYQGTGIAAISDATADTYAIAPSGGGASTIVLDRFVFNASSGDLLNAYENSYRMIGAANTLLARLEGKNLDPAQSGKITAEAKFLRAFAYFNLVQLFGDVTLRTTPATQVTGLALPRNTAEEVYAQIVQDLADAVNGLDEKSAAPGRVNKIAALALLGKVQLTQGNYAEAVANFEQVIGKRRLYPAYADVFKIANENNTVESIFEVQYGLRPYNSDIVQFLTPNQITGVGFVYGVYQAEPELLAAYEPEDARRDITLWNESNGKSFNGFFVRKFNDGLQPGVQATDAGQVNFPLLRYADVLLLYAEALNAQNGGPTPAAYAAVNQVRKRAGLPDLPEGLSQPAFLEALLRERMVELAGEGHRWFDLKRTGKLAEKLASKGFVTGRHEIFPIPQAARDANPALTQNDGY